MHIKSRWNKQAKTQSPDNIASAIAMVCWKIATQSVLELENKGYQTHSQAHRLQIIGEFLAFLLQVSDRLAYENLDIAERERLITALAKRLTDIYADNQQTILNQEGPYRQTFIDLLNSRAEDYAELSFQAGQAGFDFLRYFGECVEKIMAEKHWVSQEITDIHGPIAVTTLTKSFHNLLGG